MQVEALASGSSGNAFLLRSERVSLLLEAGLPAARLAALLRKHDVDPASLNGIVLSHAHSDHAQGARALSDRFGIRLIASAGTLSHQNFVGSSLLQPLRLDQQTAVGDIAVTLFPVPHDCVEPTGFTFRAGGRQVCFVTDLGHVPESVQTRLAGSDLLILESNHDEEMLWSGPYPSFLKRRVASSHGHLSNRSAADCLAALHFPRPATIWLTHLSEKNNQPDLALRTASEALNGSGRTAVRIAVVPRLGGGLAWDGYQAGGQLRLI